MGFHSKDHSWFICFSLLIQYWVVSIFDEHCWFASCIHVQVFLWMGGGGASVTQLCPTPATLWTRVHQAPLSVGFFKQEYWSRLPFPSPGDLPNPCLAFPDWATREAFSEWGVRITDVRIDRHLAIWACHLQGQWGSAHLPGTVLFVSRGGLTWEQGESKGSAQSSSTWITHRCLGNSVDTEVWRALVHGVAKESDSPSKYSGHTCWLCKWIRICAEVHILHWAASRLSCYPHRNKGQPMKTHRVFFMGLVPQESLWNVPDLLT